VNYHSFFKRDYKSTLDHPAARGSRHWRLRGLALAAGVVLLGVVLAKSQESGPDTSAQAPGPGAPVAAAPHHTEKPAGGTRIQVALTLPEIAERRPRPAAAVDVEDALQAEAADTPGTPGTGIAGTTATPEADTVEAEPIETDTVEAEPIETGTVEAGTIKTGAIETGAIETNAIKTRTIGTGTIGTGTIKTRTNGTGTTDAGDPAAAGDWEEVEVRRGDTLSAIFSRLEIHSQLNPILSLGEDVALLRSIHPGERIRALKQDGRLQTLVYEPNRTRHLHVTRSEEGYTAEVVEREMETRVTQGFGSVRSSLFQAGLDAGLSDNLIMTLANIFGWDIDFALDLREGDHFAVIYEQLYQDGEYVRDGAILAAEFVNRDRSVQALRYTTPEGSTDYYSPDGRSMRKAFLRMPVEFARISSRFGTRRHPILHTMRQHRGVDYAASTGTPIRASGDGRIVHRGTRGGYGKTIIIQHGQQYRTLYAHMNGYARNTAVGSRVRQGQVIGYVGATGMATGPHLHYEFLVNGVHRDPLTVKLPDAEPLPEKYLSDFKAKTGPLLSRIDTYRRVALAQIEQ
jgi:murein DD-endopeptidase MepM/ murein hydrolase activator NlpD